MAVQQGNAVKAWQEALAAAGYDPGAIDGQWGQKTSEATKKFQADSALVPDGKVEDKTRAAMQAALEGGSQKKPFYKTPLFWVAMSGAVFVAFTAWRDGE
jgi:peptidoglycan hydrolase-like protein with peptidoglycan-binding domain